MAPMGSNLCEVDGQVGERLLNYYEERARGGAGLIIVGVASVMFPAGACNPNQIGISDDSFLAGLTELAARVHRHGARIAIQLQHAGKVAVRDMVQGRTMWVPSVPEYKGSDLTDELTPQELDLFTRDLRSPTMRMDYREMDEDDIQVAIDAFAAAAERARRAGFDAVELHAGHGYLLSSFLSPASNRRTDRWGGPLANRARLLLKTLETVRERCGEQFPVWCRLDAIEFHTEGGIAESDGVETARLAAAAGADAIHVSAYADSSKGHAFTDAPIVHQPSGFVAFAQAIKAAVAVPVIAVGRIELAEADRLIAEGSFDFVAMARKLLADPDLPAKLAAGQPQTIRPCVYCYTCVGRVFLTQGSRCAVNPASGREAEVELPPAPTAKRIAVIGAGPSGLETARRAALRGHQVSIYDGGAQLGGALRGSVPVNAANGAFLDWLVAAVQAAGVSTVLNRSLSAAEIAALAADEVVLAVGAKRPAPSWPGAGLAQVIPFPELVGLLDSEKLLSRVSNSVVLIGGGMAALQVALYLARNDRSVSIVESTRYLGAEMAPPRRWRTLHELNQVGVRIVREAEVTGVVQGGVEVRRDGELELIAGSSVILSTGAVENLDLADELRSLGVSVHTVGDCNGPRFIEGAMRDAASVAALL